jgi:hypothetical protein
VAAKQSHCSESSTAQSKASTAAAPACNGLLLRMNDVRNVAAASPIHSLVILKKKKKKKKKKMKKVRFAHAYKLELL